MMGRLPLDDIELPSRWGKQPVRIGTVLKQTLSSIPNARERHYEYLISELWREKMLPAVRRETTGLQLRSRTLYVGIASPGVREALHLRREDVRRQLNEQLGAMVVAQIIFQ